jgi:protein ImuA
MLAERANIISQLQKDILLLQGYKPASNAAVDVGLGPIKEAFPNHTFPLGAVHEFLSAGLEGAAATSGFIAGLLAGLMGGGGTSLWVSSSRTLFPPALRSFGIQPDRFIFIDLQKERHGLWAIEEALKCGALTAVVGEMQEISFTASRRLQLAVEQSQVTGFILRNNVRKPNTTACVSRWRITPLPSVSADDLPGIGFPHWKVELLRIRNGRPGIWEIKWEDGRFLLSRDVTHTVETKGDTRPGIKELPSRGAMAVKTG